MIVVEMRVFPFSFPPIKGGAQGGVSPTPTPDPTPDPDLYDLSNAKIVIRAQPAYPNWRAYEWDSSKYAGAYDIALTGVVVLDSSAVSSVIIDLTTLDWTAGGNAVSSATLYDGTESASPSNPLISKNGNIFTTDSTIVGEAIGVSGDATFTAYDSNGEILQQDTITVVGF